MIAENNTEMNMTDHSVDANKTLENNSTAANKVVFPGRKMSVYHEVAASIAAVSNEVYLKNKTSVLAAIETL
jgi:hypothetical protein